MGAALLELPAVHPDPDPSGRLQGRGVSGHPRLPTLGYALISARLGRSTSMGFAQLAILYNTQTNGPLSTTIVGSAKNVFTTYLGYLDSAGTTSSP